MNPGMSNHHQTPNQSNFDPCGDTSPNGCSECPMNGECYPDEGGDRFVSVDEAFVVFRLSNGEAEIMALEEFLDTQGLLDDEFDGIDDDPDVLSDPHYLLAEIQRLGVVGRVTIDTPNGQTYIFEKSKKPTWTVYRDETDDEAIRELDRLMSQEHFSTFEEYEQWD